MEKDNVFTYEPKMKANLELIMDIMRYDCDYVVYKDKQIADLEAKLAQSKMNESFEKEKKENAWKFIEQLKQQLAEKDRQIEQLKKFDDLNKTFFDLFRTAFKEPNKVDDLFNTLKTMQEKQDQDKISFCIEKLEWVQKLLTDNAFNDLSVVLGEIENQIEELKKEMK